MTRVQVIHDLETMLKCFSNIVLCSLRRMFTLIKENIRRSSSDLFGISCFYKKLGVKLAADVKQAPDNRVKNRLLQCLAPT